MSKSIAVFGGNGFLGRKICEVGINRGYNITSYSRSGQPPKLHTQQPPSWIKQVSWQKCDIFHPHQSISPAQLSQFDTIIHSIGILFEDASYKKSMNSNFGILQDVQRLANRAMGSNPMQKDKSNQSYEAIQRDSAVLIADEYINARVDALKKTKNSDSASTTTGNDDKDLNSVVGNYVYISADQNPPIVPQRYIITKREAEFELSNKPHLRSILMRPGIMYEEDHFPQHDNTGVTNRDVLVKGLKLGVNLKNTVLGQHFLSNVIRPVVSTTQVANAIFDKLEDDEFRGGVVPVEEIEQEPNFF
ncbi:hypothetical protein CANMA_000143 [Candida margitis]|uniref:uncharacterized protein n=1 Tax=Candida margitis TaxID=1775924 RepID=UPI002227FD35|nr:uncharacterized protein CANMA_000143 [Candida margitis]KAI5970724.1 hypothetical protein CANMA_000143 [Candida margitis]